MFTIQRVTGAVSGSTVVGLNGEMPEPPETPSLPGLTADCTRCAGLCCVALSFARSVDFPVDKAAGEPCTHLQTDFRCGIHDRLRPEGYRGCTVYDCFGAGQQVTRAFGDVDWRAGPVPAAGMFAVFHVVRALHELLWLLESAGSVPECAPLGPALAEARAATLALTTLETAALATYDVGAHRAKVNLVLREASALARAGRGGADLAGADLVGRDLRGTELGGASLRGGLLAGADLSGVDLSRTDLTGADLRDTDLSGADLSESLFVSQAQVDAARGSASTRLPAGLRAPAHWSVG